MSVNIRNYKKNLLLKQFKTYVISIHIRPPQFNEASFRVSENTGWHFTLCKTSRWLPRPKRNFCFKVNGSFCTTWCVTLYVTSAPDSIHALQPGLFISWGECSLLEGRLLGGDTTDYRGWTSKILILESSWGIDCLEVGRSLMNAMMPQIRWRAARKPQLCMLFERSKVIQ